MTMSLTGRLALALACATPVALFPMAPATATAQPASASDARVAGQFIDGLADKAFAILRDKSLTRNDARARFRDMLRENFAVQEIGVKLIRRHLPPNITPAQYRQYQAVFPDYVVGTYADRLYDYANADLRVLRTRPRGTRGDIDVTTRITTPDGAQPIETIWTLRKTADGKLKITNLTVAGVNLTLTQEADFDSYIRKNGFDALVRFMKEIGTRS